MKTGPSPAPRTHATTCGPSGSGSGTNSTSMPQAVSVSWMKRAQAASCPGGLTVGMATNFLVRSRINSASSAARMSDFARLSTMPSRCQTGATMKRIERKATPPRGGLLALVVLRRVWVGLSYTLEDKLEGQNPHHAKGDIDQEFKPDRRAVKEVHHRDRRHDIGRHPDQQDHKGPALARLVTQGHFASDRVSPRRGRSQGSCRPAQVMSRVARQGSRSTLPRGGRI